MKRIDVCGMGNGLVDILIRISDEEFASLNYEKATMRLVEREEQMELLERFRHHDAQVASGGSVANSTIAIAQLGGKAAYMGCLGDDRYGIHFKGELEAMGVEIANWLIANETTGTCISLITPDGERTMRTCLAVCNHLSPEYVNAATIQESNWLFIEGYLFSNPGRGQEAIRHAVSSAKKSDCKVAVTFSEPWVVTGFGDALREVVRDCSLVLANEAEACAFTGTSNAESAIHKLSTQLPHAAVTASEKGAYLASDGKIMHVEAFPCTPIDLTGAGDVFAGAYLYGLTHGFSSETAGRGGCYLAREVITRVGPRLTSGTRDYWDQCIAKG